MNNKKKKQLNKVIFYIVLILLLIVMLFPFFIMFMTSIKPTNEAIAVVPSIFPKEITFQHYIDVFNPKLFPFIAYLKNSFIVSLIASVFSVFIGIFGAYAMSKLNFKFKKLTNSSLYTVYMFSGILLVVPLFQIISGLGLYNTRLSLIIVMIVQTLPTSIFMLKSYFDTIPKSIEEAAMIDGLSRLQTVFYIIIPLSIAGISSVFVYAFMVAWNDYLFASIFLTSSTLFTLPVGLNSLFSTPDYVWGRMMAASLLTALPVVLMYAISEKFIKANLIEGGVKG